MFILMELRAPGSHSAVILLASDAAQDGASAMLPD